RTSRRTPRRTASCASCPARCRAGSNTAPRCPGSWRAPRRSCSPGPRPGCSRTACCRGPHTHAGSSCAARPPPSPPRLAPARQAPESLPVSTPSVAPAAGNEAPGRRPGASQLNLPSPSLDAERVQGSAHRNLVQIRRLGHGGCADGTELVAEVQARRDRQSDPPADAAPHRHVLLAGYLVGNRVTDDPRAQTALPQDLAGGAVDGAEVTVETAVEAQATVRDERSAPVRIRVRDFPH